MKKDKSLKYWNKEDWEEYWNTEEIITELAGDSQWDLINDLTENWDKEKYQSLIDAIDNLCRLAINKARKIEKATKVSPKKIGVPKVHLNSLLRS